MGPSRWERWSQSIMDRVLTFGSRPALCVNNFGLWNNLRNTTSCSYWLSPAQIESCQSSHSHCHCIMALLNFFEPARRKKHTFFIHEFLFSHCQRTEDWGLRTGSHLSWHLGPHQLLVSLPKAAPPCTHFIQCPFSNQIQFGLANDCVYFGAETKSSLVWEKCWYSGSR